MFYLSNKNYFSGYRTSKLKAFFSFQYRYSKITPEYLYSFVPFEKKCTYKMKNDRFEKVRYMFCCNERTPAMVILIGYMLGISGSDTNDFLQRYPLHKQILFSVPMPCKIGLFYYFKKEFSICQILLKSKNIFNSNC